MWLVQLVAEGQLGHMKLRPPIAVLATFLALILGVISASNAYAQSVVATGQSFITPRLLPGKVLEEGGRMAGLRLSLEPGWKTYWRSPGETGIPPKFDWSGSKNVRNLQLHWPSPQLFQSFGMRTAGYSDVVLFPLEVTPVDASLPIHLNLSADLGVCKEICVLEHVTAVLDVAPKDAEIGARQIRSALRRVPKPVESDIAQMQSCQFTGNGRDRQMVANLVLGDDVSKATVLIENSQGLWIRDTRQSRTHTGLRLEVDVTLPKNLSWIDRSAFRMTILSDMGAYDLHGCSAS